MEELMLLENPIKRRRNPAKVRSYTYYKPAIGKPIHVRGYQRRLPGQKNNPTQGGKTMARKRNPAMAGIGTWFQGVDIADAGAAFGGVIAASMIPGLIITNANTAGRKMGKLLVSLLSAAGAGYVGSTISNSAGKMAAAGGLAGTCVQGIGMFSSIQIGSLGTRSVKKNIATPIKRSIRESRQEAFEEDYGAQVSVT